MLNHLHSAIFCLLQQIRKDGTHRTPLSSQTPSASRRLRLKVFCFPSSCNVASIRARKIYTKLLCQDISISNLHVEFRMINQELIVDCQGNGWLKIVKLKHSLKRKPYNSIQQRRLWGQNHAHHLPMLRRCQTIHQGACIASEFHLKVHKLGV